MFKNFKPGLTTKMMIAVAAIMLGVNLMLGVILTSNSKTVLKELINNRMLDISNTAADLLDGDALGRIQKEDKDTEDYRRINDTLTVFQDNINLKYIYCIRDMGGGNFVFTVDPTVEDPGEFGEPIVYTRALDAASKGVPSVDDSPYEDAWGSFYSSYSPVFDSSGKVAGIVAVDFSADWYNKEIARQTWIIVMCASLAMLLGIAAVFITTGRTRGQIHAITKDLTDVAHEVEELSRMVNPNYEVQDYNGFKTDSVSEIGMRLYDVKEGLRQYSMKINSQANSMITALSSEYRSVYYIDLDRNDGVCYQAHRLIDNGLKQGEHFNYIETMTRYANDYVADKYRDAFLHFIDPDSVRKGLEKERIITFRYVVNRFDQETYEMVRMAGVRHPEDRDDHIVHAVGLGFTDVDAETRRTLNQSQALSVALSAAEGANKAKTAFLSNMSHEIRTPMNAIIGLDRIALNDPDISDTTREHLEKIGSSADHLLKIINDILDMSRIEAGRMTIRNETFSLNALLEQIDVMIGGQCNDKGLGWHREVVGDFDDYYIGDDMKLKQIFINILGNSVKFTPEGGDINFTIERTTQYDNKSVFKFTMADTGIGMSEDYLPKLFEPFSQEDFSTKTKYGSTGLGMSITKSIVELMNGDIQVESEKDKGTTFTVTVTLGDAEQKIDEFGEITPQEMSVLIVDDDSVACEYAQMELEKAGIASDIVFSGAEAVEMVMLKHARREPYNLILVDWKMPDMDGLETTRQIRSIIGFDSAIVILTSFHWDDILEDASKAGVDTFIAKPLRANNVLQQFKQAFALKARNAKNKVELKGKHILLAEDVAVNAEIIQMVLKMREMTVDLAENGRIAVEMFESHPDGYYDAILMDMRMPEMDGLEATRAIRAMDRIDSKVIPIVALTANAFDEDVQRSLQAGLNAHLSKPVEPENLFETLESLIRP